jgi:hypothetical protein
MAGLDIIQYLVKLLRLKINRNNIIIKNKQRRTTAACRLRRYAPSPKLPHYVRQLRQAAERL